ncbi:CRISPR-associated endonuclease Cas1, partial [Lactobacillus delbrueckii]
MGWRNVIITQHSKLSYSSNMMVVHTKDGVSQIPVSDINMLVVLTTQAVITSALIAELAKKQTKVIFVDEKQALCQILLMLVKKSYICLMKALNRTRLFS